MALTLNFKIALFASLLFFARLEPLCHEYVPNCARCSDNYSGCLMCQEGYFLLNLGSVQSNPDEGVCVRDCAAFRNHKPDFTNRLCVQDCDVQCGIRTCASSKQACAAGAPCHPTTFMMSDGTCSSYACPAGFFRTQNQKCAECDRSCYECAGPQPGDCISCQPGYFLKLEGTLNGKCEAKSAQSLSFQILVSNNQAEFSQPKQNWERTGAISDPFIDIRDALIKADELAAPYTDASVTIYLTTGTHYILLQEESLRYAPSIKSTFEQLNRNYKLTIKPLPCSKHAIAGCAKEEENAIIVNKIGSFFQIKAPQFFTIQRVIFDFSDSLIKWGSECQKKRSQSCLVQVDQFDLTSVTSLDQNCECRSAHSLADTCNQNHPLSLIDTIQTSPYYEQRSITLNQVTLQNIFSRYNSLIGFDTHTGPGVILAIKNSIFDNISICGSVINSEIASPQSDLVSLTIASLFNQPAPIDNSHPFSSSISIESSSFTRFGLSLELRDENLFISSYNNLEFQLMAHVLNLNSFPGYLSLSHNHFYRNKLFLDFQTQHDSNVILRSEVSLMKSKTGLIKQGVIVAVNLEDGITLYNNTISQCSGLRGAVQIQVSPSFTKGAYIANNEFFKNTGWYRADALNLRSSYHAGQERSCLGFHVVHNLFYKNSNLPRDNAVMYLGCVYSEIAKEDGIDDISPQEITPNAEPVIFERKQNLHVLLINEEQQVVDYGYVAMKHNTFLQNYRGKGQGQLLQIIMMNQVEIEDLKLYHNGDIFVMHEYEPQTQFWRLNSGLHFQTILHTNLEDFTTVEASPSPFLGDTLLFMAKMRDLRVTGLYSIQNWYYETSNAHFAHFLTLFDSAFLTKDIKVKKLIEGDLIVKRLLLNEDALISADELVDQNQDVGQLQGSLIYSDSIQLMNYEISRVSLLSALVHSVQQASYSFINMTLTDLKAYQFVKSNAILNITIQDCILESVLMYHTSMDSLNGFIYSSHFSNQHIGKSQGKLSQIVFQTNPRFQTFVIKDSTFKYPCGKQINCPEFPFIFTVESYTEVVNSTFSHLEGSQGRAWFYFYRGFGKFFDSTFEHNIGALSTFGRVAGFSAVEIYNCTFRKNIAQTAATFRIQEIGSLKAYDSKFIQNKATKSGGAFGYAGSIDFEFYNCFFYRNEAVQQGSVLQGFSEDKNKLLKFKNCTFSQNKGPTSIYVLQSNILFQNLTYTRNLNHFNESSPLYFMATQIAIRASLFQNKHELQACSQNIHNLGGFINDITDNSISIESCIFKSGCAKQGGAIYMGGFSDLKISNSRFQDCRSMDRGGALFAINFNSWLIQNTLFQNNFALVTGADILAQESTQELQIQNCSFTGQNVTPIFLDRTCAYITGSKFKHISATPTSQIISCQLCRGTTIKANEFSEIEVGSAVLINGITASSIGQKQFEISNNQFTRILASQNGGALQLFNPQVIQISENVFNEISVGQGQGGSILYSENNALGSAYIANNTFSQSSARIGGAISWKNKPPSLINNTFTNNTADIYGQNIASFPRKLSFIDTEIGQQLRDQLNLYSVSSPMRTINLENIRSGQELPVLYISQLDRYNQIVTKQSRDTIYTAHYQNLKSEQEPSVYIPLLSNENKNEWKHGIMKLEDIILIGEPGKDYIVELSTPLIDESLIDTQEYLSENGLRGVNVEINIKFRNCIMGQAFLNNGACQECAASTYLLEAPTRPTECNKCPENAICYGGTQIGPIQGYWRSSQASINFIPCFNYQACLGSLEGAEYDPLGTCETGYHGILCASCETGYTRSSLFECKKCPSLASNIVIMTLLVIVFAAALIIVIRLTLSSAIKKKSLFTVLFKIMINHVQVIMLISSFKFEWPEEIIEFFNASKSVANAPQEIFSIDCFIQSSIGKPLKRFYIYLIIYVFIPVLVALVSCLFFRLKYFRRSRISFAKALTSFLIVFFLIHPSLTRAVLDAFHCKNIDGDDYMAQELTEKCWIGDHLRYGVSFGSVGILLWVVGIPLISFVLLYHDRKNLSSLQVKQKYGFLYNGYNNTFYYWEIVTASRKVLIAFVSVFLVAQGTMIQSLVLLLVLVGTILITLKVRPYLESEINFLEIYSMISLIITVYCGIYYLSSRPSGSPEFITGKDFTLHSSQKWVLFLSITFSNGSFFLIWSSYLYKYLKKHMRQKCKRCYICFCLLGNRSHYLRQRTQTERENVQQKKIQDLELVKEELDKFKQMYKKNVLFQNKQALEGFVHQFLILFNPELYEARKSKKKEREKRAKAGSVVPMLYTDKLKLTSDATESKSTIQRQESDFNESLPSTNRALFESPRQHQFMKQLEVENRKKLSTFTSLKSDAIAASFINHVKFERGKRGSKVDQEEIIEEFMKESDNKPRKRSSLNGIESIPQESSQEESKQIPDPHPTEYLCTEPRERNMITTQMSSNGDYQSDQEGEQRPRAKSQRKKSLLRKGIKRVFFDDNYKQ